MTPVPVTYVPATYNRLIHLSSSQAVELIAQSYQIKKEELVELVKGNFRDKLPHSAWLILNSSHKNLKIPKEDCLTQITPAKIAALVTDWSSPVSDTKGIENILPNPYGTDDPVTALSNFQRKTAERLWGKGYAYQVGEPTPAKKDKRSVWARDLNVYHLFFFGAVKAAGTPYDDGRLTISGEAEDSVFYNTCLEGMLKTVFKLNIRTQAESINHRNGKENCIDHRVRLYSRSWKLHSYLQNRIDLFDKECSFLPLKPEHLVKDQTEASNFSLAYLMGMIAAGGYFKMRDYGNSLQFDDSNRELIHDIKHVIDSNFLPFDYRNPSNSPGHLTFSQAEVQKMAEQYVPFKIVPGQIGLLTNLKHIARL
ncbi:MAG: hypothetical protein V1837_03760 [Candidatus Woesearchaeota archaeon]